MPIVLSILFFICVIKYFIPIGLIDPVVSAICTLSAPASVAALKRSKMKSKSVLVESSAVKATKSP